VHEVREAGQLAGAEAGQVAGAEAGATAASPAAAAASIGQDPSPATSPTSATRRLARPCE
jgi:hypothetical protein